MQKHRLKSNTGNFSYALFDSVHDINTFADMEMEKLNTHNAQVWREFLQYTRDLIGQYPGWFGTPSPSSMEELEQHRTFLNFELLKSVQPKVKDHLAPYLRYSRSEFIPKPKIAYNAYGMGIFSFDRAAMGLFRLQGIQLNTPVEKTATQLRIELGRSNPKTTAKDVFAYFENKPTSYPSMRLYIQAGANLEIQGDEMLYVGLACSELITFLEERGVAVELNVLFSGSYNEQVCVTVVCVKRFQDSCDKNQILLMSSDPRYYRYRGFKIEMAVCNAFGLLMPQSFGPMVPDIGKRFVSALGTGGFVFEQSYSLDAVVREVIRIIETFKARNYEKAA